MTTITLPRELLEQALEALEKSETTVPYEGFGMARMVAERKHHAATIALSVALTQEQAEPVQEQAEPVQEPVWIQPDHLQKARIAPFLCRVEPTQHFPDFVALHTAPPKREPLTDEEIALIDWESLKTKLDCVRAIERKVRGEK